MKFKLKPLSVAMIATATALAGCSSDNDDVNTTAPTQAAQTAGNGYVQTAVSGLTCRAPDIVQVIDSDFYPLTQSEKDALRAAVDPEGSWTAAQIADWNSPSSYAAYDHDYDGVDLYAVFASVTGGHTNELGLTKEEQARQVTAKAEAREFKANSQKQTEIFGDNFDAWFDGWFATVAPTDYLGESQRLNRARRGLELSLSTANDSEQVCYTPPTSCPNFQVADDSGQFDCVTPFENPLAEDQPNNGMTETMVEAGQARVYYKASNHVDGESAGANLDVYKDVILHLWNDDDCTAYTDDTVTSWSQGPIGDGIDPDYGMYWDLDLVETPSDCGNIIVFNRTEGDAGKKISSSDLRIPLGNEGSVLANADKQAYFQDGVNALNYDGKLYANAHPLIGAASGTKSCGWGTELNESGEACVGQVLESCPDGTVAVGVYIDPTDPSAGRQEEIASKCVVVFDPETAPDLYVRGAFHDAGWGADENNLMSYAGNGVFQLNFAYDQSTDEPSTDPVTHGFKIADADWSEATNFGGIAGADAPSVNGSAINITVGEGVAQNLSAGFVDNNIYQFVMDASTPSQPTFSLATVPIDAFPKMTIGEQEVSLNYGGNGTYSANKLQLTAGTYTITIADESSNYAVGAEEEGVLTDGEALAVVDNGSALSYTVAADGEYDFTLDYTAVDMPTFTAKPSVPYGTNRVFIRGTMTGWGNPAPEADELIYNADTSTYSVVYGLEATSGSDAHQFKFASQAWGGPLDLNGDQFTFSDDENALPLEGTGNIAVKPEVSTAYNFSISFAESTTGEVKVEQAPIYIRGGIYGTGDWGTDETMRLNFEPSDEGNPTEAGHVYSSVVTTTGPGFFKIADEGWGGSFGFNYGTSSEEGAVTEIQLGSPLQLVGGGDSGNISFQHPAGTYRFSFDDVTKQITVTSVE